MALILNGSTGISTTGGTTPFVDGAIGTAQLANDAVTTPKIAANAVVTADIADAAVTIPKLSATGTPSSTTFLRGDGSWQIAGGDPTTTQVLNATAGASVGAVGTYAFLKVVPIGGSNVFAGATVAGSTLQYTNGPGEVSGSNPTPSGTWRVMGYANNLNGNGQTLYLRIS
jgi:hypothetical protein